MSLIHPQERTSVRDWGEQRQPTKCSVKDNGYKNTTTSLGVQDFAVTLYSRQFMRLVTTGARLSGLQAQACAALQHFTD